MESLPKKSQKSILNVRKSGVHFRGCGMFILGGLLTITYITITLPTEFPFGKLGNQIIQLITNF